MVIRKSLVAAFGMVLFALALTPDARAIDNSARTTYLTFSQPVRLPGVALPSGTYIFERASPFGDPKIVRVMSRDRNTSYYMGFTTLVERPSGLDPKTPASLGEAARGAVPPVNVWWLMNESKGHAFIYR